MTYRALIVSILLAWSLTSSAAENTSLKDLPVGKADWYYSLGGASPVLNFSDQANVTRFDVFRGDAKWNLDACNFDFKHLVNAHLGDPKRNLYALEKNIVNSAKQMLRVSALGVIQRANPGLYDLLTRGIANAQVSFDAAVKNCQQIRADVASGKNPLYGWLRLAAHARWTLKHVEKDPTKIEDKNKADPGSDGVPWVDGKYAGGRNQKPISITADVISAGYRSWYGDKPKETTLPWSDADQAVAWAQEVLGEAQISFCKECKGMDTRAGHGLQIELARGQKHYRNILRKLVLSDKRPQAKDVAALSANRMGIGINIHVVQALKNESPANRDVLINRLASEIALSDAMEKSLVTRQLLYAGAAEPNIASNGEARTLISEIQDRLRTEMENVLFENRVRQEVLTNTAQLLLARSNKVSTPPVAPKQSNIRSNLFTKE